MSRLLNICLIRHPSFLLIASISLLLCLSCGGSDNEFAYYHYRPDISSIEDGPLTTPKGNYHFVKRHYSPYNEKRISLTRERYPFSFTPIRALCSYSGLHRLLPNRDVGDHIMVCHNESAAEATCRNLSLCITCKTLRQPRADAADGAGR